MKLRRPIILLLLSVSTFYLYGQRFSLLAEVGGMRSQIDGDKIQGFYYNGYNVAIGSNYAFNSQNFLSIKTAFYSQGSTRKDQFQPKLREGFQLEIDLRTIGVEISYKFAPAEKRYFLGAGVVQHQVVDFRYKIIDNVIEAEQVALDPEQISSSFTSAKFFYGFDVFPKGSIYFSLQSSMTNMLESNFEQIRTLTPYSVAAVFTYEIIASKIEEKKSRPGAKTRTRNPSRSKKKKRR